MADIQFYQDDSEEGLEEGADDDLVSPYGGTSADDFLTPLQKLERYMESENIFTRQMVARGILDTLRAVGGMEEECEGVLVAMSRLSDDYGKDAQEDHLIRELHDSDLEFGDMISYEQWTHMDSTIIYFHFTCGSVCLFHKAGDCFDSLKPSVRSELMEQIPHISMYCQENSHVTAFSDAVPHHVLPMIVRYLTDTNNQVRKTSQAALLVLLEKELVDKGDVEEQICPIILQLTGPDSIDDLRTEAVALMSKMTPLIGKDITERLFLPRFAHLCSDTLFHVRKVCAANFGDMCSVVGSQLTEDVLLIKFYSLCEDGVWGVRKACAECFMQVSCACSQDVRHEQLARHFVGLLCDQSRWVRMAAFQALGPFISTFADMGHTGLYLNEDGVLCIQERRARGDKPTSEPSASEQEVQYSLNAGDSDCDKDDPKEGANESNKHLTDMDIDSIESTEVDSLASGTSAPRVDISFEELRAQNYTNMDLEDQWSMVSTRGSEANLKDFDVDNGVTESKQCEGGVSEDTCEAESRTNQTSADSNDKSLCSSGEASDISGETGQGDATQPAVTIDDFNAFNYWRTPLPVINLEEIVDDKPCDTYLPGDEASAVVSQYDDITAHLDSLAQTLESQAVSEGDDNLPVTIHTASESLVNEEVETVRNIGSTHVVGQSLDETLLTVVNGQVKDVNPSLSYYDVDSPLDSPPPEFRASLSPQPPLGAEEQDVIPQALLENYLSMIDPSRAQTVDTDIVRHCAYSFPAVAYTLGNSYWYCLKSLYETLAGDMQWKVRRTLAFSIHELAVILGPEITTQDLVPIFNGFLKDLDEVRIGVLKHLADFLRLLDPSLRQQYLPNLSGFMTTDNNRNWRFRLELADQLIYLCELYSPEDIATYMAPLAMQLAADKVSEVRNVSFRVLSLMLRRLRDADEAGIEGGCGLADAYVKDMIDKFAKSPKWFGRQTFAQLCYHILHENAMGPDSFARELLPSLLELANDSIPNVKIAVSRSLSQSVLPLEYFTCYQNPHHELLLSCVQKLQSDTDRDVRYYAALSPQTEIEHHETVAV